MVEFNGILANVLLGGRHSWPKKTRLKQWRGKTESNSCLEICVLLEGENRNLTQAEMLLFLCAHHFNLFVSFNVNGRVYASSIVQLVLIFAFTFHRMTLSLLMPTPCPALVATKDVQDPLEQMLGSRLFPEEGFFKPSKVYQSSCPGAPHGNDSFQPRISLPILQLRSQETAPCTTHRELTEHWDVLASKGFCCVTSLGVRRRNISVAFVAWMSFPSHLHTSWQF